MAERPTAVEEARALVADFRAPQALIGPRIVLWALCKEYGWSPADYLSCWTSALVGSLGDLLEAVPALERRKLDPEFGALKTGPNDWMDANIVGAGARSGTLLTTDRDLHRRCTMLYSRDLIEICSV